MLRRALLATTCLFLIACSDDTQPALGESGSFTATLGGARAGLLAGSANASAIFTELGEFYAIRMFAPRDGKLSFLTLICTGATPIPVGTQALGPGEPCEGRYGIFVSDSFSSATTEFAIADGGRITVSALSQDEIDGSFSFQGPLLEDADTVGVVSARGSFRARRF